MGVQCLLKLIEMTLTLYQSRAWQSCAEGHVKLLGPGRSHLNAGLFSAAFVFLMQPYCPLRHRASEVLCVKHLWLHLALALNKHYFHFHFDRGKKNNRKVIAIILSCPLTQIFPPEGI